ncbi:MAG: cysteine methyltransferase [Thermoplasmata archaeon HGW-Thermoplasmata-1]|nr:MAG: cysteine methyltransferase [Thermoplasmata archaeon HGW-Thermoplasmata-1]
MAEPQNDPKIIGEANLNQPPFYRRIYAIVHDIPKGRVSTYGAVALAAGKRGGARAVGNAMNRNQDTACVPCHRVVKSDGNVGGYYSGTAEKIKRLNDEGLKIKKNGQITDFDSVLFTDFNVISEREISDL